MNSTSLRKSSIALAIVAAMSMGGAMAATANTSVLSVAKPVSLRHGDAVMGALPASQPMQVVVVLKVRDAAGLEAFNKASAKNPGAVKPMTAASFMANHAPSQVQAQTVANYLSKAGFTNVQISANRMLVTASGNAATAGKAFMTTFAQVKTHDGRIAYANTSDVRIPGLLGGSVLSVLGMQNVHQGHVTIARPKGTPHRMAITGHNPLDFSPIYGGTGVQTAAGVPVGIFTNGDVSSSITDLNTFTNANGLAAVTTSVVKTNGGGTDTSGQVEWDLDSQDIVGAGGGQVGSITFYTAPTLSDADMTANFNTIVTANATKIINVSIGGCETYAQQNGTAAAVDQILSVGVAQGQTFSISTGDSGADECGNGGTTPSWPANSPYVVAVAGTTLDASTGSNATWNSEVVWPGSGGSASKYEPKPTYQTLLVPGDFRGVADVAFAGDPNSGAIINVGSGTEQVGGTSLSAPIFAGLWARVLAIKGQSFGFANPYLYQLPWSDFHDITSGSNGISAKVGYDFASGRGSMILSSALTHIGQPVGQPPVASFSYVINGLKVHFNDTSNDPDGSITFRSWNFGDGSPTATGNVHPTHTYAGDGTYNATLTVADNDLNLASTSQAVTVKTNTPIKNAGFETGTTPWVFSADGPTHPLRYSGSQEPSHGGQWAAWLGGQGKAHTDTVSQRFHIPSWTGAQLNFWLHVDTNETNKLRAFDKLTVGVYSNTGTLLANVATFDNRNAAAGYQLQTADLSAWVGQTVTLRFTAKEDATMQTSFVIDDVTLKQTSGGE
ncbi:MAG: PKD domain-containing protein [Proteobacteria bacterium]|nr:PKD domain-containing protein [Pseudomonadota bacterium]